MPFPDQCASGLEIIPLEQPAGGIIDDKVREAAHAAREDRDAGGERLKGGERKALKQRWHDEEAERRPHRAHIRHNAVEENLVRIQPLKFLIEGAVAVDVPLDIGVGHGRETAKKLRSLLSAEPP